MSSPPSINPTAAAPRVAVVGAGIVSPLGFGLAETLASLKSARDCVQPMLRFPVEHCRCKTAAQVADDRLLDAMPFSRRMGRLHRASHMMICALGETLRHCPGFQPELSVVGTTSGGMSFGEAYYRSFSQPSLRRKIPAWIANYPPQKPVLDAQETFHISAPAQVIANACASGTNAIGHGFECIRSGRYQRVLTGGYDAISELVFVGFDSLQAATADKCRPFDRERSGLVLGEGAAILALENWEAASARGAEILAEITGYGISTDNHHLTQPNPSGIGARQAMQRALASAQATAASVDYINAHGTATPFNDAAEGKAVAALFGRTPLSSTKGMMGHSLGAAGAIEAVICLLALQHQFLPANINFREGECDLDLAIIANAPRASRVETALSNSFGFGGTNASILLKKTVA